jgi:hypothetical protein
MIEKLEEIKNRFEEVSQLIVQPDMRKVLGENFLRAFAQAEKAAGNRRISADGSLMKLKK